VSARDVERARNFKAPARIYDTYNLSLASSRMAVSLIITKTFGRLSILLSARSSEKSEGISASTSDFEIDTGLPCRIQTRLSSG
jgi:hypothetical protein